MIAAVQGYGNTFECASDRLKANKEFLMASVQKKGSLFWYVSEDILNYSNVAMG